MGRDKIELFSMDEAKLFKYLMFEKMLRTVTSAFSPGYLEIILLFLDCLNYI